MSYIVLHSDAADEQYENLKSNAGLRNRFNAVCKTLSYLKHDPRHPSLSTHKFKSMNSPNGKPLFVSYAQNKTPAAYRIFWYYGPDKNQITVIAITPHP